MKSSSVKRLALATSLLVRPICNISGVPGMSVGVMHQGNVIFKDNIGLRNAVATLAPTSKTAYCIGSITKSFSAAAIANLFDGHEYAGWNTPVEDIIAEFQPSDQSLRGLLSTSDFLSHRSGLFGDLSFALQGNLEFLLPPEELIRTVNDLPRIAPFRQTWFYNNWGYAIVGAVIEKLSGRRFGDYLKETILDPLNLTHTTSQPAFGAEDDFADAHITLHNARPHPLERSFLFKDSIFEAAGGVYSNVDDILQWAKAVLRAEKDPAGSPLRQISTLISNQIPLDNPSHHCRFYGMGWIRTQLPGVVGLQGENPELLEKGDLPILGAGSPPMITYYHQGAAPGYYSALFLFPETESAVVVLTNTMPLNDAADWIAQVYITALFDFSNSADYIELARESRRRKLANFDAVISALDKIRRNYPEDKPQPLATYLGKYFNNLGNFHIDVRQHPRDNTSLEMRFQGKESQVHELRHLYGDVFEWAMNCDETAKRGRAGVWDLEYFKVYFQVQDGDRATSLTWAGFQGLRPEGILMCRDRNENDKTGNGTSATRRQSFRNSLQWILGFWTYEFAKPDLKWEDRCGVAI